jgi:hypothetical protein
VLSASLRPLSSGRYRRTAYTIVRIEGAEPTEDVIINGSVVIRPQCGFRSLSSSDPAPTGVASPDASLFDVPDDPPTERAAGSPRTSPLPSHMPLSFSLAPGTCRLAFRTLQDTLLANMSDTSLTADWSASDLPPLYLDAHPFTWTSLFGHTSLPWASALG